jgi:hypothetical protein
MFGYNVRIFRLMTTSLVLAQKEGVTLARDRSIANENILCD